MKIDQILEKYIQKIKQELVFYNNNSYSPYSKFKVSAVLLIFNNKSNSVNFVGGTNIENSSYGLTICAERVAIFNAVSNGLISNYNNKWLSLFLYVPVNEFVPPCGACRQVISEFVKDIPIVVFNKEFDFKIYYLSEIFKETFGPSFLK